VLFTETELPGAWIIDLERHEDSRGFFARAWDEQSFAERGLSSRVVQCNVSWNAKADTLRGMHFQRPPHAEVKLIRCTRGAIWDVIADIRPESPTYGRWVGVELTAENRRTLYIPEGFAHGYQTLVDDTETYYQVSAFYAPGAEGGIRWDDPALGIEWPETAGQRVISDKDRAWPDFSLEPAPAP
jgi:dTDP-4-dehydrorhamnose 3,5-epimerase